MRTLLSSLLLASTPHSGPRPPPPLAFTALRGLSRKKFQQQNNSVCVSLLFFAMDPGVWSLALALGRHLSSRLKCVCGAGSGVAWRFCFLLSLPGLAESRRLWVWRLGGVRAGPGGAGPLQLTEEKARAGLAEASGVCVCWGGGCVGWGGELAALHTAEDVAGWSSIPLPWDVAGSLQHDVTAILPPRPCAQRRSGSLSSPHSISSGGDAERATQG